MRKEIVEFLIKVTGNTDGAAKGLKGLVGPATALTAAAGAAGLAFKSMADEFADSIDQMLTLAADTGASVEMINGLRLAAEATGKQMTELIPKGMAKRIVETSMGAGEAKVGFDRLGMSADMMSGKLSTTDEVLRETLKRLFEIEDPTERAGVAILTLGKQGAKMLSTFADVGDLDAYIEAANRLTPVTEESTKAMADWQQAMARMGIAMDAATMKAGPLISVVAGLVENFTLGMTAIAGFGREILSLEGGIKDLLIPGYKLSRAFQAGWTDAKEFHGGIADLADELDNLAESASAEFDPFATSAVTPEETKKALLAADKEAAKELAAQRKAQREQERIDAVADAEQLRQDLLQAMLVGPGDNRTTLLFGEQVAAAVTTALGDTDAIMEDWNAKVAEMQPEIDAAIVEEERTDFTTGGGSADADAAIEFGDTLGKELVGVLGPIAMIADVPGLLGSIGDLIDNLPEAIAAIPLEVLGIVDALGELPAELMRIAPQLLLDSMNAALRTFYTMMGFESIVSVLEGVFNSLPGDIAKAIADVLGDVIGELNPFDGDGAFLGTDLSADKGEKTIFGLRVPGFDTGGEVTATGLAYVHEGERVQSVAERRMPGSGGQAVQAPQRIIVEDRRAKGPYGLAVSPGR